MHCDTTPLRGIIHVGLPARWLPRNEFTILMNTPDGRDNHSAATNALTLIRHRCILGNLKLNKKLGTKRLTCVEHTTWINASPNCLDKRKRRGGGQ